MGREEINWPLLAFIAAGTLVLLAIPQDYAVVPRSPLYWAIWTPALFSLFATRDIVRYLLNEGIALLFFGALSSLWFLAVEDYRIVAQTLPLIWITAWIASAKGKLPLDWLMWGLLFLIVAAAGMYLAGCNVWGLLPFQTVRPDGEWRVSIFPNIAWTFSFLLPVALILTMDRDIRRRHQIALLAAVYLLVMSQGRSALLAFVLYVTVRWLLIGAKTHRHGIMAIPIMAAALVLGATLFAAPMLFALQDVPFVSLFLRGETGLSFAEIQAQLYRPWLWAQHFKIFLDSPFLLGAGSSSFTDLVGLDLNGQASSGSESFITRMFATYGLLALLFFAVFVGNYVRRARRLDTWACAASASIVFMMMTYGSAFHPSSPINALCLFILFHGSEGFLATKKVRVRRRLARAEPQVEPCAPAL